MAEAMFSIVSEIVERQEEVVTERPYLYNASPLEELRIEARIFEHLGPHPGVIRFLSWDHKQSILRTDSTWLLHTNGGIHCDIKTDNFLLDEDLDLKVCDFAGSSLPTSHGISSENFWDYPHVFTQTVLQAAGSRLTDKLEYTRLSSRPSKHSTILDRGNEPLASRRPRRTNWKG
ncbi:hypothetical protein E4T45_03030 [Aureobasidium sp. EXF-8846]|nr:hypothetical protein E4T45_03030 [Aureobasidium sp. EXF-8846]